MRCSAYLARHAVRLGVIAGLAAAAYTACGPAVTGNASGVPLMRRASARYAFYPVEGETAPQLAEAMRANRLYVDNRLVVGRTDWSITWRAAWGESGGVCRAARADVSARITVWLPRWTPPPTARPELVEQWQRFVHAVSVHEAGHVDIALEARREVRSLLRSTTGSCAGINARAQAAVNRLLQEYRRRQDRFDARERRAANPDLRWPPRSGPSAVHEPDSTDAAADTLPPAPPDSAALTVDAVRGCYRLVAAQGSRGMGAGEFWSAPVRLDSAVARRFGPTPLANPDRRRRAVVTYAPPSDALTADTLRHSSSWSIIPPDTLRVTRTTGFHGESSTLRWRGGRFVGEREYFSDTPAAQRETQPVELVPVGCPPRG